MAVHLVRCLDEMVDGCALGAVLGSDDGCALGALSSIGASSAVVAFASLSPLTGPLVVLCRLIRCCCSIDFLQNTWNQYRHRTFLQSVQNTFVSPGVCWLLLLSSLFVSWSGFDLLPVPK
jgi:hypothetical protein